MAELACLADILHRYRLSAYGIVGHSKYHKWHITRVVLEELLEVNEVYVTLEWDFELGVFCLFDGHVNCVCTACFDMTFGGVEVRVTRDDLPLFYKVREEYVLCSTTLVSRDDIVETRDAGDSVFEFEEGFTARVAFVAEHERSPLAVGHGSSTRVGKQVNIHLLAAEHKDVVFSFF